MDRNELTLTAEKHAEKDEKSPRYNRREFKYTNFTRSFNLPESANGEGVKATYNNGILLISIPKLTDQEKGVRSVKIS